MSAEQDTSGAFRPLRRLFRPKTLLMLAGGYIALVMVLVVVGIQAVEFWSGDGGAYCRDLGWSWNPTEQRCIGP